MRTRREGGRAERVYRTLVRAYPAGFREEYGEQLLATFVEWNRRRPGGVLGWLVFWVAVLADLARSVRAEWSEERARRRAGERTPSGSRPPYAFAAASAAAVFALYVATLAPTAAFWDAGEYIAVARVLGIPHPPGSPLFVMLARSWDILLEPLALPIAVRINLFGAAVAAGAHFFWFLVVERSLRGWADAEGTRLVAASAAVAVSATAFTVWSQSNVNEKVYAVALLTTAMASWLVVRWRDTRSPRVLLLVVFLLGLSSTNHMMGVLVAPAALALVWVTDRRALFRGSFLRAAVPLVALALSANFFLPIRAALAPVIAEGAPVCADALGAALSIYSGGAKGCESLSAVLTREQYAKPPITSDPNDPGRPRDAELVGAQFLNYAQYFNWQWGRGVGGRDALMGGPRVAVTALFLLLGLAGLAVQLRADRSAGIHLGVLFLTLSAGLVVYLNFRYGYSIGWDRHPDPEMHEVRERDYFFLLGFSVWGLWVGIGTAALWRRTAEAIRRRWRVPALAAAPVLGLALLPLALNWQWASRSGDFTARDWAYNLLMSVEPYGVLFTNGDNDTFPLWYLQEAEGYRRDVTVVVLSYLNTPWYVEQLRELTKPCGAEFDAEADPTRILCQRPLDVRSIPRPLVDAGWTTGRAPPRDSIAPISDEEIERIASSYAIASEPMTLRAGEIEGRVEPGTLLLPADIFAATILRATAGDRPVYLMPGAPIARTLGLEDQTRREGLVWKLATASSAAPDRSVVALPAELRTPMTGAAIDLTMTDTLFAEVYLRRGRILDPSKPWPDEPTTNILRQYFLAHQVAAQGYAILGDVPRAEAHIGRAEWWLRRSEG